MRVGLFLRNLDEEFQITVYQGVRDRARERGVDLVCVQGETIHPDPTTGDRPFALAFEVPFDGLLVLSSVIVDSSDSSRTRHLARLLPAVPAVSLGMPVENVPSVTFRSRRPLERVVEHLILDHGCRRLLYLGGPPKHRDSQARGRVVREVVRRFLDTGMELELSTDHGGFSESGGREAIQRHLGETPYDAVVAANDNMALGVLKVLRTHGDGAWRRCAVTGFDDIPQAALLDPPLTSVHQSMTELGARGLDTLLDQIAGRAVPGHGTIESRLVIRQSCGCGPAARTTAPASRDAIRPLWEAERRLRQGNDFGRDLSAVADTAALLARLDAFLAALEIQHFFLLVGESEPRLLAQRSEGLSLSLPPGGVPLTTLGLFSRFREGEGALCVSHLRSGGENLGLVVYGADDGVLPYVGAALPHLAHALRRLKTQAEQEERSLHLEAEVLQISEFERRRFGSDLHDDICQRLAGIAMYLKSFANRSPEAASWTEAAALVEETLQLTRAYAHASFPSDLEGPGLGASLRRLCETVALQNGCPCHFSTVGGFPLTEAQALNLYRMAQEALQNAVKHARATRLEVTLNAAPQGLELRVADNGTGIGAAEQGLGWRSMTYRADQLGASFRVEGEPGWTTVVRVLVPPPIPVV